MSARKPSKRTTGRKQAAIRKPALKPGALAALLSEGRLEEAAQLCRAALASLEEREADSRTRHRLQHNLAAVLYRLGRSNEALGHLNQALALEETSAKSHFLRGLMLTARGESGEAATAFSRVLALASGWTSALIHRGAAYFALGDYSRARQDFQAARDQLPDDPAVTYNLALADVCLGRWEEAQGLFRALAELEPDNAASYYELLAQSYRAQTEAETYGQVHRLKNMMGMVGDRLRLVEEESANQLDPVLRRAMRQVSSQYDLIYHDMTAFLRTVRREPLELDVVDLHQLLDGALVAALSPDSRVEVIKDYDQELPEVVCDPQLVREAFLNLILNALEAMAGEGVLSISTGRAGDDFVYIIFVDTGPGVAPEDAERIFHLGHTTKPFGSGIGLTQVRRALGIHGGHVEVSTDSPGATFTVYVPRRPRLEPSLEDLSPKAKLLEDAQDLLIEPAEGDELLV